jgi:serine/threonine protein phosphatase PrpC
MLTLQDNGESNRYWAGQSSIISYATHYRSFRGKSFIDPEFNCSAITPDDQLILATDGFWADLSVSNQLKLLEGNFEPNNEPDDVSYLVIQRKSNGNGSSVLSPENFFTGFGQ